MKYLLIPATVALIASSIAVAATPADTITARQGHFKAIGKASKGIRDELAKPSPDANVIKSNAAALTQASSKLAPLFPKGTGPESGAKTKALPAIWQRNADFTKLVRDLNGKAKALQLAAGRGDMNAVKAAMGPLGQTCKSCHDQFREKD